MMSDDELVGARPKRISGRIDALTEQFKQVAEATYGVGATKKYEGEQEKEEIPYTQKHIDLLENPEMLDIMVKYGDSLVKDVPDIWRVVLMAEASCFAPPIVQGERDIRPQTHVLIIGEYSTAKSSIYRLIMRMCPRALMPVDFTPVALMGSVRKDGMRVKGLAEEADRSIVIIDEFDKILARSPTIDGILRTIMEEQRFYRKTSYGTLSYITHPVILAGANPKEDVFRDELMLRQVPFKYGLLSRFDYIRPLAYNTTKIIEIAEFMAKTCFRTTSSAKSEAKTLSVEDIKKTYYALMSTLNTMNVHRVEADVALTMEISNKFAKLQKEVAGIPLLSVRDFMSAMRFFNASAVMHVRQRKVKDGILMAQEPDLKVALQILEATTRVREMLLTSVSRRDVENVKTPYELSWDIVVREIQRFNGSASKRELVTTLVAETGMSRASAYGFLKDMVAEKKVRQAGLRNSDLSLPEA